jgi:carboxymethylenebutenolidase
LVRALAADGDVAVIAVSTEEEEELARQRADDGLKLSVHPTVLPSGDQLPTNRWRQHMRRLDVQIPTPDGTSNGTLHFPDGDGPWPAVVVFPDAGGARETLRLMGDRLAEMGYVALVPDIYYRAGDWAPFEMSTVFTDEKERARLFGLIGALTNEGIVSDTGAYAAFLLARPEVSGTAIGTTGYCLGGRMSLVAAGGLGDTIGAAASFHGGGLAVADKDDSPHLAAGRITATVYVAGAQEDNSFTVEQAALLADALTEAGVDHTVEFYNAHHGFAVADNGTYDDAAAAKHWAALDRLYGEKLTKA